VVKSDRAAEAIALHPGVKLRFDDDPSHPLTLAAPLPTFDGPSAPIGAKQPDLSDQFLPGYYATGAHVKLACGSRALVSEVGLAPSVSLQRVTGLAPLASTGCGSGGVEVLNAPYTLGYRTPAAGSIGNGASGSIAFWDLVGDYPDQSDIYLKFNIWGEVKQGYGGIAGGQSTYFLEPNLGSGVYPWQQQPWDVTGESGPWTTGNDWPLSINKPPGAPGLVSPADGAAVPTPQPVLSIGGASDPEGDSLGYAYLRDDGCRLHGDDHGGFG
jgi:hypothetical protein